MFTCRTNGLSNVCWFWWCTLLDIVNFCVVQYLSTCQLNIVNIRVVLTCQYLCGTVLVSIVDQMFAGFQECWDKRALGDLSFLLLLKRSQEEGWWQWRWWTWRWRWRWWQRRWWRWQWRQGTPVWWLGSRACRLLPKVRTIQYFYLLFLFLE